MGRRRSVAETIERRFPSARRRPGAWHLPVLALGRMRALPRIGNAARMSLWGRAPREVYRVYGDDQYLESASEGDGAPRERATEVEPDASATGSWTAFADGVPAPSAGNDGSSPLRSSRPRAGRLVGFGLLVGVSLATLAVLFLNLSHRQEAAPESLAHGPRVQAGQRADRVAGAGLGSAIAPSENTRPAQTQRFSTPSAVAATRSSGATLEDRVPARVLSNPASRSQRAWMAPPRSTGNGGPEPGAVESPTAAPVEPPAQDEFGFER